MPIAVISPVSSTYIFAALLFAGLLLSLKRKKEADLLPPSLSQELKGFAMLAIVLAHIGYFLVADHRFLFPLSILAGTGVDMFLFLSGFGLTVSALKKSLSIQDFYVRHLPKLYIPFWITLSAFFILDFYFIAKAYSWGYMTQSFFGFFPHADLFQDINSPLWYFTFILFFYLMFPLIFSKKIPILSALLMYVLVQALLILHAPILFDVAQLYTLHALAFPLGMLAGSLYSTCLKERAWLQERVQEMGTLPRTIGIVFLLGLSSYFAYFSGIGTWIQVYTSLLVMAAVILIFIINRLRIGFLYLFGLYSYEIYLIHWPLMSRYDFLYRYLPAWLATLLYLPVLLGIAWTLHQGVLWLLRKPKTTFL
jgi:peptidoglycan/LPS O-acetylase OafA/YrhL